MRTAALSALLLGTTTGVVMAANSGCRVAMPWEAARAQTAVTRKVHHSAATLARWKIGAETWSKAHNGQIYAGHQPVKVAMVWRPLTYRCGDIALETDFATPLLSGEAPPEFGVYASAVPADVPELEIASAQNAPSEEDALMAPIYGGPMGGIARINPTAPFAPLNGPVGPSSFPPVGPEPTPRYPRLVAPKHAPDEVTLLPTPLPPPVIVPTPEPSAVVLLSTGLASLGLARARRWLRV